MKLKRRLAVITPFIVGFFLGLTREAGGSEASRSGLFALGYIACPALLGR